MMDERNGLGRDFFRIGTPQCGFLTGILGVALAFCLIFLGFWNTLFIVFCFALGYGFGAFTNKIAGLKALINKLFPPSGE